VEVLNTIGLEGQPTIDRNEDKAYRTVRIRTTLDNDLHDGDHVGDDLDHSTDDDRDPDLLIARRKTGQQEPHHASTGYHG